MVIEYRPVDIHYAIKHSESVDMIEIIGIVDDKYQHINGVNVPQDDDKCAREAIREWENAHRK